VKFGRSLLDDSTLTIHPTSISLRVRLRAAISGSLYDGIGSRGPQSFDDAVSGNHSGNNIRGNEAVALVQKEPEINIARVLHICQGFGRSDGMV